MAWSEGSGIKSFQLVTFEGTLNVANNGGGTEKEHYLILGADHFVLLRNLDF